jgi:hypothetical protein
MPKTPSTPSSPQTQPKSKVKGSLSTWLEDLWTAIKDILGLSSYTAEQVSNMTIQQFSDAVLKDMFSGQDIKELFKNDTDNLYNLARESYDFDDFTDKVSFRDQHSAPSRDTRTPEEKREDASDFSLREVAQGIHNVPDDYFDQTLGPRYYGYKDKAGMESLTSINNITRGLKAKKGNQTVKAYRSVPKGIDVNELKDHDWISFSKDYAVNHGESRFGEGEYKVIEQEVSIDDVWWDGNDIREWGYDTGNTKKYSRKELKDIWDYVRSEQVRFNQVPITIQQAIQRNNNQPLNLAPNGNPSILYRTYQELGYDTQETERLVAQTYSDQFGEFFGRFWENPQESSKVVDANMQPLVVWHGTDANFNVFSEDMLGSNTEFDNTSLGFFFADKQGIKKLKENNPDVFGETEMPVFLSIKKELDLINMFTHTPSIKTIAELLLGEQVSEEQAKNFIDTIGLGEIEEVREAINNGKSFLKDKGHDGVIDDMGDNTKEYVVFNPNQIKSATENIGTFSTESNDIRFSVAPVNTSQAFAKQMMFDSGFEMHLETEENLAEKYDTCN